jgi:hypothetical protein
MRCGWRRRVSLRWILRRNGNTSSVWSSGVLLFRCMFSFWNEYSNFPKDTLLTCKARAPASGAGSSSSLRLRFPWGLVKAIQSELI